jgi:hypothetical protein
VDVAHKWGAEAVDEELDRLISKRAAQDRRPDPDQEHERWKMSVAAYNARKKEAMRAARVEYHQGQAIRLRATLEELIAFHETRAARLCEDGAVRGEGLS